MIRYLFTLSIIAALLGAARPTAAIEGKLSFKEVRELPSFPTAGDPNLDLSDERLAASSGDIDLPERDIVAAINRWNNELYPHNSLAGRAYLLAVLMDPVTARITREVKAAAEGCTTPKATVAKICEWTMAHMSHTQQDPSFADFPGNDPWGIQDISRAPTYRKLLPSEMAAMKIRTGRISGKCMTLAHLIGGIFLQLGTAPDDLLFLHMQMNNYTHGVALLRYRGELFAVNNMAVVPAPFRNGTNPQDMNLKMIYNHNTQIPCDMIVATGVLDSTRLASSRTIVEGFLDNCGLPHSLEKNGDSTGCDPGDPASVSRFVMESGGTSRLACLSKYAYQSLYVKHPGYYLTASLRTSPPRDLVKELEGVTDVLAWIEDHIAGGSIFPDGGSRLMTADQVLVFQRGSPKDRAVLAYTLLKHLGSEPAVVLTQSDGFIELDGLAYSLSSYRPADLSGEEILFRLRAEEEFPGLKRARIAIRDMAVNGKIAEAMGALEEAARTWPGSWRIQEDLARAYRNMHQSDRSFACLQAADSLDPGNPDRLNLLAWRALERRDPEAAIRYCTRGLAIEPENGYLKSNLIQGYIWSGRFEEARDYFRAHRRVQLRGKPFLEVVQSDIEALSKTNTVTDGVRSFAASLDE